MYCNFLLCKSCINTFASGDSLLVQPVKELDLCLFLCVIQSLSDRLPAEPINDFFLARTMCTLYIIISKIIVLNIHLHIIIIFVISSTNTQEILQI